MNVPFHVLGWFWALLLTLGESCPGWLLGVPPLTHLGVAAPPHHRLYHLPFACCVLMAPTIRTERKTDALPVTWKMPLLSVWRKPQPLSELNRSTITWAIPFRVFIYLLLTWLFNYSVIKVSSQHRSDCIWFHTQVFYIISCCSWSTSFKRSPWELLIIFLDFFFPQGNRKKFLLLYSEYFLEPSTTYLRIFKLLGSAAGGQKPFASGSQTISAQYALLLAPNYITANCSAWCCIKCSWEELPPDPGEGHWSPNWCVWTEILLGLGGEGALPRCACGHPPG